LSSCEQSGVARPNLSFQTGDREISARQPSSGQRAATKIHLGSVARPEIALCAQLATFFSSPSETTTISVLVGMATAWNNNQGHFFSLSPLFGIGKTNMGEESAFSGSCGKDLLRPHLVIPSLTKTNSSLENDRSEFPRGLQFRGEAKTSGFYSQLGAVILQT
jgi:hypothetical protein